MSDEAIEPRLSVQLGTRGYGILGSLPERDLDSALSLVARTGAVGVEVMSNLLGNQRNLGRVCDSNGLAISGIHVFWSELADSLIETVARLDTSQLIVSGLPCATPEECDQVVGKLLHWSEQAGSAGASLLLHNHAEDCTPFSDGRTPFSIFAAATSDMPVGFAIDLYWALQSGTQTAELFQQLHGRCFTLHLKDGLAPYRCVGRDEPHGLGEGDVGLNQGFTVASQHNTLDWVVVEREKPSPNLSAALTADVRFASALISSGRSRPESEGL